MPTDDHEIINVDDDNDIDMEELQGQIDLEMARTQNLVASWINSNYGSTSSRDTHAHEEQEIEELLRRPPRCVALSV